MRSAKVTSSVQELPAMSSIQWKPNVTEKKGFWDKLTQRGISLPLSTGKTPPQSRTSMNFKYLAKANSRTRGQSDDESGPDSIIRRNLNESSFQTKKGSNPKSKASTHTGTQEIFRIQDDKETRTAYGLQAGSYKTSLFLRPTQGRYNMHKKETSSKQTLSSLMKNGPNRYVLADLRTPIHRTTVENSIDEVPHYKREGSEAPANSTLQNQENLKPIRDNKSVENLFRQTSMKPSTKASDSPALTRASTLSQLMQTQTVPSRYYSESHHLLNLMHGIYMQPKAKATNGQLLVPCRVLVGEGNNSSLVGLLLKHKPGVVSELFFSKSNLQWTQTQLKQLVATPIYKMCLSNLKTSGLTDELPLYDLTDVEAVASAITKLKIFRVFKPHLVKELLTTSSRSNMIYTMCPETTNLVNHLKGSVVIAHKTKLAKTVVKYCKSKKIDPFSIIPTTFLIRGSCMDIDLQNLLSTKMRDDPEFADPLIVKPGENSNRGIGISVAYSEIDLKTQVECILKNRKSTSTVVVQYYLSAPLLFQRRKFDIRCYGLIVRNCPRSASFYWYLDGYARTSSFEYELHNKTNLMVHLTNEAIQVKDKSNFGAQEPGNKVYFNKLDEYFRNDPKFTQKGKQWNRDIAPLFKVSCRST